MARCQKNAPSAHSREENPQLQENPAARGWQVARANFFPVDHVYFASALALLLTHGRDLTIQEYGAKHCIYFKK
jgi:hypothetical protein